MIPEKSLLYRYPEIAKELHPDKNDGLDASQIASKSNKKVFWLCSKGHEWQSIVFVRTNNPDKACPICEPNKLHGPKKVTSLLSYPHLIKEWDHEKNRILPGQTGPRSHKKVFWICSTCQHRWSDIVYYRVDGKCCPKCTKADKAKLFKRKVNIESGRSLQDLFPELAAQWHPTKNFGLTPDKIGPRSNKKVWWKKDGKAWQTSPNHRTYSFYKDKPVDIKEPKALRNIKSSYNKLSNIDKTSFKFWLNSL